MKLTVEALVEAVGFPFFELFGDGVVPEVIEFESAQPLRELLPQAFAIGALPRVRVLVLARVRRAFSFVLRLLPKRAVGSKRQSGAIIEDQRSCA